MREVLTGLVSIAVFCALVYGILYVAAILGRGRKP